MAKSMMDEKAHPPGKADRHVDMMRGGAKKERLSDFRIVGKKRPSQLRTSKGLSLVRAAAAADAADAIRSDDPLEKVWVIPDISGDEKIGTIVTPSADAVFYEDFCNSMGDRGPQFLTK
eukprot:12065602-Karenia_brevis.AAC.1